MHLPRLIARGKQEDMGTSCGQEQGTVYAHVIATSQCLFFLLFVCLMAVMSLLSDQTCLKHPEEKSTSASASAFHLMLLLFLLSIFLPLNF